MREAVNDWIRSSGVFDGVIDFDKITRDPQNPTHFNPPYDSGDHLHPSDAGYKAMGEGIDLTLLRSKPVVRFFLCGAGIRPSTRGPSERQQPRKRTGVT